MSLIQNTAFLVARKELGVKEIAGDGNAPRVVEYHAATSLHATSDAVPWCSAFMNWCFHRAGDPGTNSALARSWLTWGKKVDKPMVGDVVVLKRGNDGVSGHVGFVAETPNRFSPYVKVLGGNQDDQVCEKNYLRAMVLGYRRLP